MLRILICEDDAHIRKLIATYIKKAGYIAIETEDGKQGIEAFEKQHIDFVITDVMMPVIDGMGLVNKIRLTHRDLPILMLTALEDYQDKEKGFESGVDDYMVKPVDMNEMMLRIKALLRRYQILSEHQIVLKHLSLNYKSGTCTLDQHPIELTRKEFTLLFKLLASPNVIFTREQLMNEIWGYDSESYDRTVDTHIKRIRERVLTEDFEIVTVRGLGYKVVLK